MPKISKRFAVAASASAVWEVIGPGFASIGEWATAIPASRGVTGPLPPTSGAPVAGRVCTTGLARIPEVTETLTAYDGDRRSLTYEAGGLPSFVTVARNTWTVTPVDQQSCVVTLDAQFDTRGLLGALARWLLLVQLSRTSRHLSEDLRHRAEHGTPSARKQRQSRRRRS